MKIFVSFSDDDREIVEPIVESLKGDGHKVFYDSDSLPPGKSYYARIENAINASNFMVYCVSPGSVSASCYALTELKFAKAQWPSAKKRVLPVLVQETDFNEIPPYLKAVTVLRPVGNVAAETSSEIRKYSIWLWIRRLRNLAFSIAAILLMVFLARIIFPPPESRIFGETLVAYDTSIFNDNETLELVGQFQNADDIPHFFTDLDLEFDPPLQDQTFSQNLEEQEIEFPPNSATPINGFLTLASRFATGDLRWRVKLTTETETIFGKWQEWKIEKREPKSKVLNKEISARIRIVDKSNENFVAVCVDPPELNLLSPESDLLISVPLSGIPSAVATHNDLVAVAILDPPSVAIFKGTDLVKDSIVKLPKLKNEYGEQISVLVFSLALNGKSMWVATSEDAGENALLHCDLESKNWKAPHDSSELDPHGLVLRTSDEGDVIGFSALNSPTTLYMIRPGRIESFFGANIRDIQNTRDFQWHGQKLFFRNRDKSVALASLANDTFSRSSEIIEIIRPWESTDDQRSWISELIGGMPNRFFFALNEELEDMPVRTEIISCTGKSTFAVFDHEYAKTVSLAVLGDVAIATVKNSSGNYRTLLMKSQ